MTRIPKEKFIREYASGLNENQLRAMEKVEGPVLLLAVPGSGKTTVLVSRLGYMILSLGIAPEKILTLTYTKAATKDMKERFMNLFGTELAVRTEFRTINGICHRIITKYTELTGGSAFSLITDEKETGKILTEILAHVLEEYPTESDVKKTRALITYCKNMLLSGNEIEKEGKKQGLPLPEIYERYSKILLEKRLMDYDDQMVYAYKILEKYPEILRYYQSIFPYILVDEAQDTSKIQHLIIGLLAGKSGNLFMVGDEDQSIYGFRAAYPQAFLGFEKDHPGGGVLVMDRNYRSAAAIVAAADAFIQKNRNRHEKHMTAARAEGAEIQFITLKKRENQYTYLKKVAEGCVKETAVLYRDNECVIPLVDLLERHGIPYRLRGGDMTFFSNRVVSDVMSFFALAQDPCDPGAFMRIYAKCGTYLKRQQAEELCRISREKGIPAADAAVYLTGINGMTLGKCRALSTNLSAMRREAPSKALFRIEKTLGYGEYLEKNGLDRNKMHVLKVLARNESTADSYLARLRYLPELIRNKPEESDCPFILSTVHSAKGLEFDRVYLLDICDGVLPGCEIPPASCKDDELIIEYEEERRIFYVAMTRAKNELAIFQFEGESSRFVKELHMVTSRREEGK